MRKSIVAGNWKMHNTIGAATDLALAVRQAVDGIDAVEVVLCPPYTALAAVSAALGNGLVQLGAQDAHWEPEGAYTGEVSPSMLRDAGCRWVILGHSERRSHFGETDEWVNRKARAALDAGLSPIVCVGETLEQREADRTEEVVRGQVLSGLERLGQRLRNTVIAYEPVWAIGTGRTATAEQAQRVHAFIRELVASMAGDDIAAAVRLQYGGSVKPDNAAVLFGQPDIDGGLIGGASLSVDSFAAIVRAAS